MKVKFTRKIICAAIKDNDGKIFLDKSHAAIIHNAPSFGYFKNNGEQGFIDNNCNFCDRKTAGEIAFNAGQVKENKTLYSEALRGII